MRRLNDGAGVAPAPLCTRTGGPGRPGFPSVPTMRDCLQWLDAVRMKGRRKLARISAGLRSRVRTRKNGPGVEDATVERREAACLAKARGTFYEVPDQEVAPFWRSAPSRR